MKDSSEIIFFEELPSTNLYVKEHYRELADNTLVIAGSQTAGRGRLNRKWFSPANCNIYATLLIKNVHDINLVGAIVGLAGLATLKEFVPDLKAYIKWPNDIYIGKAKIAGILSESCEIKSGKITAVACGIGININSTPKELDLIDQAATSLFCETKSKINLDFFRKRLAFFTNWYYIMYLNNYPSFFEEWVKFNKLIGQELTLIDSKAVAHEGVVVGISPDGGLMLREKISGLKSIQGIEEDDGEPHRKNRETDNANEGGAGRSFKGCAVGGAGETGEVLEVLKTYYCGDVSVEKSSINFNELF